MTDFETHPVGTAYLVKRLRAYEGEGFETTACYNGLRSEAADSIEQLEAAHRAVMEEHDYTAKRLGHAFERIDRQAETIDKLTARANAATAAAYEVAAHAMGTYHWNRYANKDEGGTLSSPAVFTSHTHQHVEASIRALATPDQTAALDKLIAEAEARVWEKAADIARHAVEVTGHRMREAKEKKNKKEERDWQSMLFCAVDIRTAILAASKKGGV